MQLKYLIRYLPYKIRVMDAIKDNIKNIAARKGLKLYEVAEACGMAKTTFSNALNNDMRTSTLIRIAKALGVSADDILGIETKPREITNNAVLKCPKCNAILDISINCGK